MFKNLFDRKFVIAFVVMLLMNLLIITFVFSSGVYTGFEGTFGWDVKSFGDTIASLFGSVTSFVLLIGTLALIGGALWFTYWLANRTKKLWIVLWVIAVALAAALIGPTVRFEDFDFAFVLILVLVVVSAAQTWIIRQLLAPRVLPTKTVVKTATIKPASKPVSK